MFALTRTHSLEMPTHSNAFVTALLDHRSTPAALLDEPAPAEDDLDTILRCGLTAPDHAALMPWRFITITGLARNQLGDIFVAAKQQDEPDFPEAKAQALRQKPLRAPLIVAVVAEVTADHPKTPRIEQVVSAGVAAQHMQLAARAMGYGSVWLTGPMARHAHVKQNLGLKPDDELVGFVYFGTPKKPAAARNRPDLCAHKTDWTGI